MTRATEIIKSLDLEDLTWPVIFTVVVGQALSLYSEHYPNVYRNDHRMTIDELVELSKALTDEVAWKNDEKRRINSSLLEFL